MIISEIEIDNIVYFNLHAEQVYQNTYPINGKFALDSEGIFTAILAIAVLDKIGARVQELFSESDCVVVIDFNYINQLNKNYADEFKNVFLSKKDRIVLMNVHKELFDKFEIDDIALEDKPFYEYITFSDIDTSEIRNSKNVFEPEFEKKLGEVSHLESDKILAVSSSIYINKYINMKELMCNHKSFMIYSIYLLAMKFRTRSSDYTWRVENSFNDFILVCQNLNSSFLGTILSDLLKVDMVILDHIGPKNKIYRKFGERLVKNKKYIVLSDVYCLGTEYKITKGIIEFVGGECLGSASLVRVNTLHKEHMDKASCSLYNITKDNNKLDYKFITALD